MGSGERGRQAEHDQRTKRTGWSREGHDFVLPRSVRLEASDGTGGDVLSLHQDIPKGRTLRGGNADTAGSGLCSCQYCRRKWTGESGRVHPIPPYCPRFSEGIRNPHLALPTSWVDQRGGCKAYLGEMRSCGQNALSLDSLVTKQGKAGIQASSESGQAAPAQGLITRCSKRAGERVAKCLVACDAEL